MSRKKSKKETKEEVSTRDDFFLDLDDVASDGDPIADDEVMEDLLELDEEEDEGLEDDIDSDDDQAVAEGEEEANDEWIDDEDELPIDVYQDNAHIYITAPVPGVEADDVDVNIEDDMVTIKAKRNWAHEVSEDDYFYKENFWGSVSRTIILPVAIEEDKVDAVIKNGVLTVTLPKTSRRSGTSIKVKHDEEE